MVEAMTGQVYNWPRFIGGPLEGQAIPDTDEHLIPYAEHKGATGYKTVYYRELKYKMCETIAIRAFVFEGDYNQMYDKFMRDITVFALATAGITAE